MSYSLNRPADYFETYVPNPQPQPTNMPMQMLTPQENGAFGYNPSQMPSQPNLYYEPMNNTMVQSNAMNTYNNGTMHEYNNGPMHGQYMQNSFQQQK